MLGKGDGARIARVPLPIHVDRHRPLKARNVAAGERSTPNLEKLTEGELLVGRRLDVDDAGGIVRVQPVETVTRLDEAVLLLRVHDADAGGDGDLCPIDEQADVCVLVVCNHPVDAGHTPDGLPLSPLRGITDGKGRLPNGGAGDELHGFGEPRVGGLGSGGELRAETGPAYRSRCRLRADAVPELPARFGHSRRVRGGACGTDLSSTARRRPADADSANRVSERVRHPHGKWIGKRLTGGSGLCIPADLFESRRRTGSGGGAESDHRHTINPCGHGVFPSDRTERPACARLPQRVRSGGCRGDTPSATCYCP